MNRTIDSFLKYGIIATIYATLLVPFIVNGSLYFPYITGKAHIMRLLIELGFAMYLVLVLRDRSYLPKKSPLMWAVVIFTIILGFATLHAENPYKSFWSNFERMEGYVTILHLFAFFTMMSATIRSRLEWLGLMNTALVVSVFVGVGGFMDYAQKHDAGTMLRIAGPLGNSTYLGVYALIHVFLAAFLIFLSLRGRQTVEVMGRIVCYTAILIWNVIVMFNTGTRGSFVGLLGGMVVMAILIAIFEKEKKVYRKTAIGFLVAVALAVGILGATKDTEFVKSHSLLNRFASLIRLDVSSILGTEGRSRTLLWSMAYKGVEERPLLGWGQDNFGYVFAKYYDPLMYDQEQWFDRTHNVFFDWLIAGGVLGLLSYLSLFIAALYLVWKKHSDAHNGEWDVAQKATLTGLFTAYFIHNLFVFDNLVSYILCFILLAYIASRYNHDAHVGKTGEPIIKNAAGQFVAILVILVALGYTVDNVFWKPYNAGKALINSLEDATLSTEDDVSKGLATDTNGYRAKTSEERLADFKAAIDYGTFGNTEIREQLADISSGIIEKEKDPNVIKDIVSFVDEQYAEQFKETPNDPRPYMFYGIFLEKIGMNDKAIENIDKAISLSPTKQSFLYQKGADLVSQGKVEEGMQTFKIAYELLPSDVESRTLYAVSLIYDKKTDEAIKIIGTNTTIIADKRISQALVQMKQFDVMETLIKAVIAEDPSNAQAHVTLAGVYLRLGQRSDAVAEIQKAMVIEPSFKTQGEYYIREINSGRDPSQGQ